MAYILAMVHVSKRCVQQLRFAYREDMERKILLEVQVERDHRKYYVKIKSNPLMLCTNIPENSSFSQHFINFSA